MRFRHILPAALLLALSSSACVSSGRYDQDMAAAQQKYEGLLAKRTSDDAKALADKTKSCDAAMAAAEAASVARDQKISDLTTDDHNVTAQLAEVTALNQKLQDELKKLGGDVDKIMSDKASMAQSLADAKARLDALQKAQDAANARAKLFKDFVAKFKTMIDAGQMKVVSRASRIVIVMANEFLFDQGSVYIRPVGQDVLSQIATVFIGIPARRFQVAGHTDNVPINIPGVASNWELSALRAVQCVKLLVGKGVPATMLSAAGYGEFDPVGDNGTPDGQAKNRRIEITLQPNMDDLIAIPDVAN